MAPLLFSYSKASHICDIVKATPGAFSVYWKYSIADRTLWLEEERNTYSLIIFNNKTLLLCSYEVVVTVLGV